jgi:hypothetical protein
MGSICCLQTNLVLHLVTTAISPNRSSLPPQITQPPHHIMSYLPPFPSCLQTNLVPFLVTPSASPTCSKAIKFH